MKSIIDILTAWWINTHHVHISQIESPASIMLLLFYLFLRNLEGIAIWRQTVIDALAKWSNFNIMLKQNDVSFCPHVANITNDSFEVTERFG